MSPAHHQFCDFTTSARGVWARRKVGQARFRSAALSATVVRTSPIIPRIINVPCSALCPGDRTLWWWGRYSREFKQRPHQKAPARCQFLVSPRVLRVCGHWNTRWDEMRWDDMMSLDMLTNTIRPSKLLVGVSFDMVHELVSYWLELKISSKLPFQCPLDSGSVDMPWLPTHNTESEKYMYISPQQFSIGGSNRDICFHVLEFQSCSNLFPKTSCSSSWRSDSLACDVSMTVWSWLIWCLTRMLSNIRPVCVRDGICVDPPLCRGTSQCKYGSCTQDLVCVGEIVGKISEVSERELVPVVSVKCGKEWDMTRGWQLFWDKKLCNPEPSSLSHACSPDEMWSISSVCVVAHCAQLCMLFEWVCCSHPPVGCLEVFLQSTETSPNSEKFSQIVGPWRMLRIPTARLPNVRSQFDDDDEAVGRFPRDSLKNLQPLWGSTA